MYARKIAQLAPLHERRHLRRGCGTLTYRRNRKKSRKAPVVREAVVTRHRQLFLVFLFVVSQFFFLQSSMFVVNDVTINGEKKLGEKKILNAMGIAKNARYWEIVPESLQAEIMELNGIESAQVTLQFPGRVSVNVAERKPVFTLASIALTKHPFAVDREGVVVSEGPGPKNSLRVVLDRPLKIGGRLSANELEVCTYMQSHLSPALRARLEHVRFDDRGDVTLRINYRNSMIPVRLGRAEKLSYKLFLLEELLGSLKAEAADVVSIDLRFSTPIVRQPYQKPPATEAPPAQ